MKTATMVHGIIPNDVERTWGEGLLDILMHLRREDVELTGVRLKTNSFLFLAWACSVDDPKENYRIVLRADRLGKSVDWGSATPATAAYKAIKIRVGHRFVLNAFGVELVVTEDSD